MSGAGPGRYICIGCPLGCTLLVAPAAPPAAGRWCVHGAHCRSGREYALQEHLQSVRVLTMTVRVTGGAAGVVSARTSRPIAKDRLLDAARAVRKLTVRAPVAMGQIILANLAGTGADLIATCSVAGRGG